VSNLSGNNGGFVNYQSRLFVIWLTRFVETNGLINSN